MATSDMAGQVALVTGGIRGIGLSICARLIGRGVRVAAGYSRNEESAGTFLEAYGETGATVHQGNIGVYEDCDRVVGEVIEQHGRLDILVNNAGITMDKTVRKMAPEEWSHVIEVNLNGAFYMSRAVLSHMIDQGYGRIIHISSVIGETGSIGQANYAAAKSGLFGFAMSLALECANKGITVNCVAPGFIKTAMVAAVPKELLDRVIAQIPAGRLGEPDEVARVVEFLADPESSYITGQAYSVNGGLNM
jgi:NAD(P)-dependent dehydrogenase (short-subunit alcohol dehydrogenase family)